MASAVAWFNNLPNDCSEQEFKTFAAKPGAISNVEFGNRNRMAWVTYSSPKAAEQAVSQCNGKEFGGREVKVEISTRDPSAPKPERKPRAAAGSGESAPGAVHNDRLIVRGVPKSLSKESISELFAKAGPVAKVTILRPRVASVAFGTPEAASKALATLNNTSVTSEGETATLTLEWEKVKAPRAPKASPAAAGGKASKTGEAVRIAVTGYPAGTTADEIKAVFASAGRIASSRLSKDGSTVILGFEEAASGDKALKLSGSSYKDSKLAVALAQRQPLAKEPSAGRKRTSGDDEEDKPARKPVDLSAVVWVGNLKPATITAEDVRKQFGTYGAIAEGAKAVLVTPVKAADAAYAYITFADKAGADKAVAANGKGDLKIEHASRKPSTGGRRRRSPRAEGGAQ